jgi:site-specific DNA-methyltransferase (adenine-specific)
MDVGIALRDIFQLQNLITWVKNISVGEESYGHFKPINSKRYITPTNETIYHFTKNGNVTIDRLSIGVPYMHKSNLRERSKKKKKTGKIKEDKRCRGNTWFIKYETIQSKGERGSHPATFPEELAEMCIKLALNNKKNAKILDPFVGSGTTIIVAKKLKQFSVGIDINSDFLDYAYRRICSK